MSRRKKWRILWIVIPILLGVLTLMVVGVYHALDPELYRDFLEEKLTNLFGRNVSIGGATLSFWGGVGISLEDFQVKDRSMEFDLLRSQRLVLQVKIFPLIIKREIRWKRIILEKPTLRLHRDREGQLNLFDGSSTGESGRTTPQRMLQGLTTLFGGSVILENATLSLIDERVEESPWSTEIYDFNFQILDVSPHRPFRFRMDGKTGLTRSAGSFHMEGTLQNIAEDLDLSGGNIDVDVEMKGIDTSHFWPYFKTWLPMKRIEGKLDLSGHYQGDVAGALKASVRMRLKEVVVDYPTVFSYVLTPQWLNISLEVDYDLKEFRVPQISVELPEIWVKGKGKIYGIGSEGMGMDAEAMTGPFDLAQAKRLIPYRVITSGVSDSLFRSEGTGKVQILSVRLSGKMPEIDHCDELSNAHVLSVELKLDGTRVQLPWDVPALDNLRGHLLFKEGHLQLRGVEGKVYRSRLDKINGSLYRLLHVPTIQIQCEGKVELSDLPSLIKAEIFPREYSEAFAPFTGISGTAEYRLVVEGELTPPFRLKHQAAYRLSRAGFSHRQLPFSVSLAEGRIDLSNEMFQWSGAHVAFGSCSLLMNGSWMWGEKTEPLEILAKGRVDLENVFTLFQSKLFSEEMRLKVKRFQGISGKGELSFKSHSIKGMQPFSYEGEFIPKGVSLQPRGVSPPMMLREGFLSFSNLGIGFSKMKVQSGNSYLLLDGSVKGETVNLSSVGFLDLKELLSVLRSPLLPDRVRSELDGIQEISGEAEVRLRCLGTTSHWTTLLREGEIRLRRASIKHQRISVPLSQVEGSLRISRDQYRIVGLQGRLADSPVALSGTISRPLAEGSPPGSRGQIVLEAFSPQLNLDPLFPKRENAPPLSFEGVRDRLLHWNFVATMRVEKGTFRGLLFQDLKAEINKADGRCVIRPFEFKAAGGDLWGEGWIEPTEQGIRFEMKPRLSHMEAETFLRAVLNDEELAKVFLSGRVYVDRVELRAGGKDFQELKESLSGGLRFEFENGVIEKAKALSRIFSMLNISQLFKGRLPDLRSKGLPYRSITANVGVTDGVVTTENLLVDSDAMRITGIGKVDLGKKLIDARVGIHPLGTVDVVLSNVPIAGYILTGEQKAFLSYVYQVKGSLDDPLIEAIPIKALGEGVLGIIKRTLETPLRPFKTIGPSNTDKNKQ